MPLDEQINVGSHGSPHRRDDGGGRVGVRPEVPPPGATRTFWAAFPLVDGPISLLLPGFPPMRGLVVPPVHRLAPEP